MSASKKFITRFEIDNALQAAGIRPMTLEFLGLRYMAFKRGHVRKLLARYRAGLERKAKQYGVPFTKWIKEQRECEAFGWGFKGTAFDMAHITDAGASAPVGWYCYDRSEAGRHVINVVAVVEGGEIKFEFYEPQEVALYGAGTPPSKLSDFEKDGGSQILLL